MVRPERRVVLAGASPVRLSAEAPGSRLQPGVVIPSSRAEYHKPLQRRLEIPAARDRVAQAAAELIIEPIYEADFEAHSYGFRLKGGYMETGQRPC